MSKYYYHGLGEAFYRGDSLNRILKILKTGGIKCKRLLGLPNIYESTCNGMDYVSVCKKLSDQEYQGFFHYESAFYNYVQNCFCLIISDEIKTVKPIIFPITEWKNKEIARMRQSDKKNRFSDICDEWQVYEVVPLSMIIGVGIPLRWIEATCENESDLEKLQELVTIAEALGLDIVDTNNPNFVEEYEVSKQELGKKVFVSSARSDTNE